MRSISIKRLVLAAILYSVIVLLASSVFAQEKQENIRIVGDPSPGRKKVEAVYGYQNKVTRGQETIVGILDRWQKLVKDPEVRRDKDALAIAYGCMGLMELERDDKAKADSLLTLAMGYFKIKRSKARFLVSLAKLKNDRGLFTQSIDYYGEILTKYDSLPELNEIEYFKRSGYGEQAYAIDAALNITKIARSNAKLFNRGVDFLERGATKRTASGLMCLVALEHLNSSKRETYIKQRETLIALKPELTTAQNNFQKQFGIQALPVSK
jgi:hypothetical protein